VSLVLLKFLGWLTARTPEPWLELLSRALGGLIYLGPRGQVVRSNLHHAFPEREEAWRRSMGRESCRRLAETALLSLATPYLDAARCRRIVTSSPAVLAAFAEHHRDPAATLICSPHLAYWEAQTAIGLTLPGPLPEFGTIFRPLKQPALDRFVQTSRERFGLRLLSRKEGFAEALKILRRRGLVGILFDQNAGDGGALSTLFGRVCSTTELPGVLAAKFNARVYGLFPRRTGFWRVEIGLERIPHQGDGATVTIGLNRWLESIMAKDDNLCASWLWAHSRWRNQDVPARRLRLESRRNLLPVDMEARAWTRLPRRTRLWIRLPNWLGDVVMALPLLRAIRTSRPDAEIILVGKPQFLSLVATWNVADHVHPLPARGPGYFRHFHGLRRRHIDVWLLFTASWRSDLEAWCSGAPQRFGLVRAGRPRPLLSHRYHVPRDFDEASRHQLELWEAFLRHFGLTGAVDLTPLQAPTSTTTAPIGLICGSENFPGKRWPVARWRELIAILPECTFVLFGTVQDAVLTREIADGMPPHRVRDLAGRTDLPAFARELGGCRLLVSNDTGGMHLANALGVPLIALFGPTNPRRTRPVFSAPVEILQPPGCPPQGGGSLGDLPARAVATAIERLAHPRDRAV
jgi:heptosyltransferase-2